MGRLVCMGKPYRRTSNIEAANKIVAPPNHCVMLQALRDIVAAKYLNITEDSGIYFRSEVRNASRSSGFSSVFW